MGAKLPDKETLIQAGIDPKTRGPIRVVNDADQVNLKNDLKRYLRIIDEQDAVNRYVWTNLPNNITSQELERMIYYKGQLCFFYMECLDEFYFMPYALDGTIDFYGRYNRVHPVPMTSGTDDKAGKAQAELLAAIKLDCVYGIQLPDEVEKTDYTKKCVLLHDYTKQLSQTIISRQVVNDPIIDVMAECIPFMRTCLLSGTGVKGMRVSTEADYPNVLDANAAFEQAALEGDQYVPIVGSVDYQTLTDGQVLKAEEFLLAMQGLDNYRLSLYGLENGGLFQKKSHMLEAEQTMNAGKAAIPLNDGLTIRQNFADIVNSITDLGISVGIAEEVIAADMNGDGMAYDDLDQSGTIGGEQPHDPNYTGIEGGSQY